MVNQLSDSERVEVINAHPRIGAPKQTLSALSYQEQGYAQDSVSEAARKELERVLAELADLNAQYEARFGFKFVVPEWTLARRAVACDSRAAAIARWNCKRAGLRRPSHVTGCAG